MKRIRVVVVDDSALMRKFLRDSLSADPHIDVVGTACDANVARTMIKRLNPDVITLDVEMPGMSGLEFLKRLMHLRPMPVVMFSSITGEGSSAAVQALEIGAIDCVAKPGPDAEKGWFATASTLIAKVKSAADMSVEPIAPVANICKLAPIPSGARKANKEIIAIGASTGGVKALRNVLQSLPENCPPIVIAQHMPGAFTSSFAQRLNLICRMKVCSAADEMPIRPGCVFVVPGDMHMCIEKRTIDYVCRSSPAKETDAAVPSIDILFRSIANSYGEAALGLLMTGMGKDGAKGLLDIRQAGGLTAVQDKETSLVFGMPKVALDIGAADFELPLDEFAKFILNNSALKTATRHVGNVSKTHERSA